LPENQKITVSNYYYVGGSYGATNEQNIMEEIYKNGPVVASFEPTPDFIYYRSGIYKPIKKTAW